MINDLSETLSGHFREKSIFNDQLYVLFLELFQNGKKEKNKSPPEVTNSHNEKI